MTKPVISFIIDCKVPLAAQKCAVLKRNGSYYQNKKELTDYVDQLFVPPTSDTYLHVKCSCGLEYQYSKDTVPVTNLNCSCGNKLFEYV
jgi:hypothetical protein